MASHTDMIHHRRRHTPGCTRATRGGAGPGTVLTSVPQQVAAAVGILILSSVAATQSVQLTGIHLALSVDVAGTLASVVLPWVRLRPRGEHRTAGAPCPASASDLLGRTVDSTIRLP
jgi:hypothetical protein